jgi:perosamine synthetase
MIEDASEALGSTYAGQACGTWGQLSCLSFNGNKIITTGGGGMLWSPSPERTGRARHLSTQARTDGIYYTHDEVGHNYRLPGVLAAIGLAQLEELPRYLKVRGDNDRHYQKALSGEERVAFQHHPEHSQPNHWLVALRSVYKEKILQRLLSQNIQARNIWTPMHRLPMYQDAPYIQRQNHSETLFAEVICLPSSANLREEDIQMISQEILHALQKG